MTARGNIYLRNTQGGRAVDTGPPRTVTGFTGLGAVGGPTGVGAGAIRALVEFVVEYNAKELKQLESDIARLNRLEEQNNKRIAAIQKERAQSEGALNRVQGLRQRATLEFNRAQLSEIKKIRDLERSGTRGDIARAEARKRVLADQTRFRLSEITQLVNQDKIEARAAERRQKSLAREAQIQGRVTNLVNQRQQAELRAERIRQVRQQFAPRLGALALGAVGGVFGGAVVGVGFAAAQAVLETIGEGLVNLLDPANKARAALSDVAAAILKISDAENLSLLEATKKHLDELGLSTEGIEPDLLAAAVATQQYKEATEELGKALEIVRHQQQLDQEAVAKRATQLARQRGIDFPGIETAFVEFARGSLTETVFGPDRVAAVQAYNDALAELGVVSSTAAQQQNILAAAENAAASAAALGSIAAERLSSALQNASALRITGLRDQLDAVGNAGPSARTQALQNQLEGMAEAQAQAAYGAQLAAIAEERFLILLEQRIRFQGEALRLEGLSAKAQLVAVNARIKRLQDLMEVDRERLELLDEELEALREADQEQDERDQKALKVFDDRIAAIQKLGDAQDRLNRLLDIQFKLSQVIRRQEGETIADFLARRASETRSLLAEQASLGREGQIAGIQAERDELEAVQELANAKREAAIEAKELERDQLEAQIERIEKVRKAEIKSLQDKADRLELEVRLQELAEREKAAAAQEGARRATKAVQDALKASQAADAAAVKSRQEAINKQIAAEERKLNEILKWTNIENVERLKAAIRGANSYGDLQLIIGEVAGAKRVLGELRALVKAGVLPAHLVSDEIANLVAIIRQGESAIVQYLPGRGTSGSQNISPRPFAQGGIIELTNALNNPFGANIRAGEEGREIAMIFSRKASESLREASKGASTPNLSVVINKSSDPWQDFQKARRMVRDTVEDLVR